MNTVIRFIIRYLKYKFTSKHKHGHGIHSPFVYNLLRNVIEGKVKSENYKKIEAIRKSLLKNHNVIKINDLGAGSRVSKSNVRKISEIAQSALTRKKYARLLYRLVNYFEPPKILELGTSLGISTLYLSHASENSQIISIEGSHEIAKIAQNNFELLGCKNIELLIGNFDEVLPKALEKLGGLDFVFFDGNHQKEPTLRYFNACLEFKNNDSIFVFDDIHWSEGMENAWNEIKSHQDVVVTIDLFFFGLVFFRKEMSKQNFIIKF